MVAKNQSITLLWILRILVVLKADRIFVTRYGYEDSQLAAWLGLADFTDDDDQPESSKDVNPVKIRSALAKAHANIERQANQLTVPPTLAGNVARISALVGLSDAECRILEFALLIQSTSVLSQACEYVKRLENQRLFEVLATILGLAEKEVRMALRSDGVLSKTGLLTIEVTTHCALDSKFDLLSDKLSHRLLEAELQPSDWLNDMICQSEAGHLQFDDYKHCFKSLQILRPYLRRSLAEKSKGVNVLLYGPPGTGKTQFAKLLASDMNCELFEITTEDAEGSAISGRKRLKALSATNSFFAKRQALILFDEIEDAFASQEQEDIPFFSTSRRSNVGRQKGWMNRLLESNNLPTLWVGNSLHGMDAAFIRRFDVVIEMPVPPKAQRELIVRKACEGLLDDVSVNRIASSEVLAPAVVTRSSRVVKSIASELPEDQVIDSVEEGVPNFV
jgi:transitional endoplasmic reticulum ATPase